MVRIENAISVATGLFLLWVAAIAHDPPVAVPLVAVAVYCFVWAMMRGRIAARVERMNGEENDGGCDGGRWR